jgi:acyl dehydratase
MSDRIHFEDLLPGDVREYGRYEVTREEIVAFASEYDPQPMHLDEEAGRASMLGGLAASGWHGCGILMRIVADGFILKSSGMGSGGIDEVRWLRPIRPGDVLSARHTVLSARASRTKPDRGFVDFRFELLNGNREVVLEQRCGIMFARRTPGKTE